MRVILLLTFFYFCSKPVFTQDLENFVLSKKHEQGTLYHIKEFELEPSCKKVDFTIDFTYLRTADADSVRVLMSLTGKTVKGKPQAVSLVFDGKSIDRAEDDISLLYVTKKKKDWATRIEVKIPEADFIQLLNAGQYILEWTGDSFQCKASVPKKYEDNHRVFAELLKYNE